MSCCGMGIFDRLENHSCGQAKMTAQELRIGNIVDQGPDYATGPITAHQLNNFARFCEGQKVAEYYSKWKPVPLTVEWLEKHCKESHFTSDPQEANASYVYHIGDVLIHQDDEEKEEFRFYFHQEPFWGKTIRPEIKYVHQLQNLYFALTGTELKTDL